MGLMTIYKAPDELMARSVRDMLTQARIKAMIHRYESHIFGSIFDGTMFRYWGEVKIDEADHERASELIGGFLGTLGELAEANGEEEEAQ